MQLSDWTVTENPVDLANLGASESVLSLGNGFIGIRGSLDEGDPTHQHGTFLAGVYERHPLSYPEGGYAHPENGEAIVPVADGTPIRLQVDGMPLDLRTVDFDEHHRTLDLRAGTLTRVLRFTTPKGVSATLRTTRLVSLSRRPLAAIRYELEVAGDARVVVRSALQVNGASSGVSNDDPRVAQALDRPFEVVRISHDDAGGTIVHQTRDTEISVAACVAHEVSEGHRLTTSAFDEELVTSVVADLTEGSPLVLTKLLGYAASTAASLDGLAEQSRAAVADAREGGWERLLDDQRAALDEFWKVADVEIDGDDELQQAVRYDTFQLLAATAHASGAPVGAKGLSGSGYSGHTFWDIEGFAIPALTYLRPAAAGSLLRWRASTLPQARERAQTLGLDGASFAWRTISGTEVSAYWPASTAAMHINADIARAFDLYRLATGERVEGADEALVETARLWLSMGHQDADGCWHLLGLTGPDEYTGVVDDNAFTNLVAARNLRAAAAACERDSGLAEALSVDDAERQVWTAMADGIVIPWDDALGVHGACASFTIYGDWDFASQGERYPIQKYAHYGKIYRRKVVKQADLVQALWWAEEEFTDEQIARDLDYYEKYTVRDSSLSACVQSVVCARADHLDLAHRYLREAALVDLRDRQGDTDGGLHLASIAGAWLAVAAGLGGPRESEDGLRLRPRLPTGITRLSYGLFWRGSLVRVDTTSSGTVLTVADGDRPVDIEVDGVTVTATAAGSEPRPLIAPAPLLGEPSQPVGREPSA